MVCVTDCLRNLPLMVYRFVNSNNTFSDHLNSSVIDKEVANWEATHKGPLSYTLTNQIGWLRLPVNDTIFDQYKDPTAGPRSAHYELIFVVCKS